MALAKASLSDSPHKATPLLREFAQVPESNAESGAHIVFQKAGLASPVPISSVNLGGEPAFHKWPVLKFSDWLRYLIDTDRVGQQLCGVRSMNEVPSRLLTFWRRFEQLHPQHQVFEQARQSLIDLSKAVPVFSHTDEGRTKRKLAILVLSVHSCIGRGTTQFLEEVAIDPGKRDAQGLNFVGGTWGSQFLYSVMRRALYSKAPEILEEMFRTFAGDMAVCARAGVRGTDPAKHYWAVQIGTKGDLPALCKAGSFTRTFWRMPKWAHGRSNCPRICHLCHAGKEGDNPCLFEDLGSNPDWLHTCFVDEPWPHLPGIMENQLLDPSKPSFFFRLDIWHNFHLGAAKTWIASSFVVLCNLGIINGASVDQKLSNLTMDYKAFCQRHRLAMHVQAFTRENLSYDTEASWPVGKWNKGAASTNMMLFLQFLLERLVLGRNNDKLLLLIVSC